MPHAQSAMCFLRGDESQPLLKGVSPSTSPTVKQAQSLRYRFPKIREKGAVLMIIWNVFFATSLASTMTKLAFGTAEQMVVVGLTVLYPVVGWLADCYIGRYPVLKVSLYSLLFSIIAKSIFLFILRSSVLLYMASCAWSLSAVCYLASIVQFTIDQSVGASGEELSFTIYWLVWGVTTGEFLTRTVLLPFIHYPDAEEFVHLFLEVFCSAIACVLLEIFNHLLMTKPQLSNPFKLMYQVLNYARKNHYPKQRSALTYWEDDYPSRIDLGKSKYDGPFTVEEVEDVKTILRLIPVVLCTMAFAIFLWYGKLLFHFNSSDFSTLFFSLLFENSLYLSCMLATIGIPMYHFVVYPLFYNHIPSMLRRIGIGLFFIFVSFLVGSITEIVIHAQFTNITCAIDHNATSNIISVSFGILPKLLGSFGVVMALYSSFEFFVAQSPWHVKGLIVCMMMQSFGVFSGLGSALDMLLKSFPVDLFPGCAFYYYLIYMSLILIIFVLFVCISKWYKLRKRDDIVPIYMLAEDNFERNYFLEQRYLNRYSSQNYGQSNIEVSTN